MNNNTSMLPGVNNDDVKPSFPQYVNDFILNSPKDKRGGIIGFLHIFTLFLKKLNKSLQKWQKRCMFVL